MGDMGRFWWGERVEIGVKEGRDGRIDNEDERRGREWAEGGGGQ